MKKIRHILSSTLHQIRGQILIVMILALMLPELMLVLIMRRFITGELTERYKELVQAETTRASSIMFDTTTSIYRTCMDLSSDSAFQTFFSTESPLDIVEVQSFSNSLKRISDNSPMLLSVNVYTDNPMIPGYGRVRYAEDLRSCEWFDPEREDEWSRWITYPGQVNEHEVMPCLTLVQKINTSNSEWDSYIVAAISYNYLNNRINNTEYTLLMTTEPEGSFYATRFRDIGKSLTENHFPKGEYYRYLGYSVWNDQEVLSAVSSFTPFGTQSKIYIQSIDRNAVGTLRVLRNTFIVILIISFCGPLQIVLLYSGMLSRRLKILKKAMHQTTLGQYEIIDEVSGQDELTETFHDLKATTEQIREKEKQYYQEIIRNQALENRQQQIEFKMLESQLNPHYLYNTLEMIRMQALRHKDPEVGTSVMLLSKTMHYVLESYDRRYVTLKEELDNISSYLRIQKLRFGDRINWDFYPDEEISVSDYPILPLILQPIVENSIAHGLENRTNDGHISIIMEVDGDLFLITVSDNGYGMSEEDLQKTIQMMKNSPEQDTPGHIGLRNTYQRIRMFYGEEYGIRIVSREGTGTRITLILPREANLYFQDAAKRNGR